MTITQFEDITGYYEESLPKRESWTVNIHPEYAEEDNEMELPDPVRVLVFCGRCGVSTVPSVDGWVL